MMIETNSKQGMAFAAAFLSLVSVQIGASIGKVLFPVLSAEGVTLTRLALAACFLWIVYKPWRLEQTDQLEKSHYLWGHPHFNEYFNL